MLERPNQLYHHSATSRPKFVLNLKASPMQHAATREAYHTLPSKLACLSGKGECLLRALSS